MLSIVRCAERFLHEQDGPSATEYAIMLALIVLVAVGAISGLGTKVDTTFTTLDSAIPTSTGS